MNRIIVTFKKDWADEFDCQQLIVLEGTIDRVKAYINHHCEEVLDLYFGTNEGFDELDPSDFAVSNLSEEEFQTIKKYLLPNSWNVTFGTGILAAFFEEFEGGHI